LNCANLALNIAAVIAGGLQY